MHRTKILLIEDSIDSLLHFFSLFFSSVPRIDSGERAQPIIRPSKRDRRIDLPASIRAVYSHLWSSLFLHVTISITRNYSRKWKSSPGLSVSFLNFCSHFIFLTPRGMSRSMATKGSDKQRNKKCNPIVATVIMVLSIDRNFNRNFLYSFAVSSLSILDEP